MLSSSANWAYRCRQTSWGMILTSTCRRGSAALFASLLLVPLANEIRTSLIWPGEGTLPTGNGVVLPHPVTKQSVPGGGTVPDPRHTGKTSLLKKIGWKELVKYNRIQEKDNSWTTLSKKRHFGTSLVRLFFIKSPLTVINHFSFF